MGLWEREQKLQIDVPSVENSWIRPQNYITALSGISRPRTGASPHGPHKGTSVLQTPWAIASKNIF